MADELENGLGRSVEQAPSIRPEPEELGEGAPKGMDEGMTATEEVGSGVSAANPVNASTRGSQGEDCMVLTSASEGIEAPADTQEEDGPKEANDAEASVLEETPATDERCIPDSSMGAVETLRNGQSHKGAAVPGVPFSNPMEGLAAEGISELVADNIATGSSGEAEISAAE